MTLREGRAFMPPLKGTSRQRLWQPLGQGLRPPPALRPWLLERRSLTQRLSRHYGQVQVRVLNQHRGHPVADEGMGHSAQVQMRDVVLSDGASLPLVVAHSILPAQTRGYLPQMLKGLGRQALGSVLFSRPGFIRYQREWSRLDQRHALYRLATSAAALYGDIFPSVLWARRAVFMPIKPKARQWVQVTEIFVGLVPDAARH